MNRITEKKDRSGDKLDTTGARLRFIRENQLGLKPPAFCKKMGISTRTLIRYEKGQRGPGAIFFTRMSAMFQKELDEGDLNWILYGQRTEYKPAITVPVLGHLSAGFPMYVKEEVVDYIYLPNIEKGAFAVVVYGNSMAPEIQDGDYVIFLPIERCEIFHGDVVVALDEFGDTMIRRYVKDAEGQAWLKSDNPGGPPIKVDNNITIKGKVITGWRKVVIKRRR